MDDGQTIDDQGLCAQAKARLSPSIEHSKVQVPIGKLSSTWKFPLQNKLCWDTLKSMKCMCIMLVLGSWPEVWATRVVNITTLSGCTPPLPYTYLSPVAFARATAISF